MTHFNGNEYDGFSFDPGTVGSDWKFGTQSAYDMRPISSRIARFNIDYNGARNANDYTRTSLGYKFKGDFENPKKEPGRGFGTDMSEFNYNPFIWGYAVSHLRTLNDSMFKITEGRGTIATPSMDVSDPRETNASGMAAYKNYPNEGYSSFGKRHDKASAWAGNTWVNGMV